jgi:hypothetical protein
MGAAIKPTTVNQGHGEIVVIHQNKATAHGTSSTASTEIWPRAMDSSLLHHTHFREGGSSEEAG